MLSNDPDRPLRQYTLGQLLDRAIAAYPDNDALVYPDRNLRMTYREFGELVDILAKGLMAMGVRRGEKIALWATNVPHWVPLFFAVARIGAILLTVNTNYRRAELEYLLSQSETENLFLIDGFRDVDYMETVYSLVPELKQQTRGHIHCEKFPSLKRVLYFGPEKHSGMYSLPELMNLAVMTAEEEYEARRAEVLCQDVVNMQYTSGTTGFPKGVMLTHYNLGNNGYYIGANMHYTQKDRICLPVPMFHCFGCSLGVAAAVNHASTMVIMEQFDPIEVMAAIEEEKCTAVYGVPTMFISMLEHKLFGKFDFSSLRTGIMAGSPCPETAMQAVMEKMYMKEITIVFGLTESSPGMTQTRTDDSLSLRVSSVGRAMPFVEVRVVDPESNIPLPAGQVGEVCCRGYVNMKGYYKMPEATAKAIDSEGWLHSGDLGVMDENGYLTITGRYKDMIIRGGENIYPRELEEFLYRMEGISDVQVVGAPSRRYGEEAAAFVILKSGCTYGDGDIKDFCRGQISRYKIPKYVAFVDSFPLTGSGKVMKFKLREMAAEMFPDD
ncbi:MAG: AMP-binding protein [Desulfarculales bacterium]|jgi:fatty-acyl-CoA synthase|nr:AMP-binding protein [Desulfarculales bacterium]